MTSFILRRTIASICSGSESAITCRIEVRSSSSIRVQCEPAFAVWPAPTGAASAAAGIGEAAAWACAGELRTGGGAAVGAGAGLRIGVAAENGTGPAGVAAGATGAKVAPAAAPRVATISCAAATVADEAGAGAEVAAVGLAPWTVVLLCASAAEAGPSSNPGGQATAGGAGAATRDGACDSAFGDPSSEVSSFSGTAGADADGAEVAGAGEAF